MASITQRAAGLLVGLCAGDKNGGPQRLALLLTYSVFIQQKFDVNDIWNSYTKWYEKGGFDTGSTFVTVYKKLKLNKELTAKQVSKSIYDDAIANNKLPSVGIGSAHRAAILSMFPCFITPFNHNNIDNNNDNDKDNNNDNDKQQMVAISNDEEEKKNDNDNDNDNDKLLKMETMKLEDVVFEESCLTHYAPLSRNCSIAVNYLCRALIMGYSWNQSLKICYKYIQDEELKKILTIFIENKGEINKNNYREKLEMGGYAPEVLKSALYFLNQYETFDSTLNASIKFAGAANYCPVLVGSVAGAMYGIDAVIGSTHFRHKQNAKLISKDAISVCIDTTECKAMKISDFEIKFAKQIGEFWK